MSNGAFFIFKKKTFKENNNRIGKNPYFYTLPPIEDIEIDNYNDLKLAKIVYKGCK
jgi:CMP-N-acetylneuraminic acid synthetase